MNRINVPIKKVSDRISFVEAVTAPELIGLFVLIMSSVLFGAFAEGRYAFLRFPNIDPKTQLGAAGATLPPDTTASAVTPDADVKVSSSSIPPTALAAIENAPLIAVDNTPPGDRIGELSVRISEHADAIAQINKELELIKDRSVSLIVEFDQNCGNWKDECATPFARELETNNSRYSQLVAKLASFNQELTKAERERSALTQ